MSEALWAQIISGFFGLASIAIGTWLPRRLQRDKARNTATDNDPPPPMGTSGPEATQ